MKKFFMFISFMVLSIVFVAALYVIAVLVHPKEPAMPNITQNASIIEPIIPCEHTNTTLLVDLFAYQVPVLPDVSYQGEVVNAKLEGTPARLITLNDGRIRIKAVQPASAAPLLLQEGLQLTIASQLDVLGLQATYANHQNQHCLYFADANTAYAIYAPDMEQQAFFTWINQMQFKTPTPK